MAVNAVIGQARAGVNRLGDSKLARNKGRLVLHRHLLETKEGIIRSVALRGKTPI